MRVSELRIGNLLRDKVSKTELKVIELTEKDIITYVIDRSLFPLKNGWGIEPILLTEEFKIEFGNDKLVLVDKLGFVIFKNEYAYQFVFDDYPYIHDIQNLYFALTNKELIINK